MAIDELRRRHNDPLYYAEDLESIDTDEDADFEMDSFNREVMLNQLDQAVRRLPIAEQNLLTMFYYEHRSIREIAFIVGAKESTVKMRLHRIRKKLYEKLKN